MIFQVPLATLSVELRATGSSFQAAGRAQRKLFCWIVSVIVVHQKYLTWTIAVGWVKMKSVQVSQWCLLDYRLRPLTADCVIRHSLYLMRSEIGSQCITGSRKSRLAAGRTAVCITRCSGANVTHGSLANTESQQSNCDSISAEWHGKQYEYIW